MAKVTIEFTGRVELDTQWGNELNVQDLKKQTQDTISGWVFLVKQGGADPIEIDFIKAKVTEVIIPLEE